MTAVKKSVISHLPPVFLLFMLGCLLGLAAAFFNDLPPRDTALRYAPMAEAFARGDWEYAFHPRIPLFFPVLAGAVSWISGIDGYHACQLTAVIFFALTVFPMYGVFRRVFNSERTAWWGALLCILCSQLLRLAAGGWREPVKEFFLALAAYALVRILEERGKWRFYLLLGVAAGAMSMIRSDTVAFALFVLASGGILEITGKKDFRRTILSGITALAVMMPLLTANYFQCGYFVPDVRFAGMAEKLLGKNEALTGDKTAPETGTENRSDAPAGDVKYSAAIPVLKENSSAVTAEGASEKVCNSENGSGAGTEMPSGDNGNISEEVSNSELCGQAGKAVSIPAVWSREPNHTPVEFVLDFLDGFYPFFALPALLGIYLRWRKKQWNRGDTLLITLWLGHNLLIALQLLIYDGNYYISKRYLMPAAIFGFGWTAEAVLEILDRLKKFGRWRMLIPAIPALALWLDAAWPGIKSRTYGKHCREREAVLQLAEAIKKDYRGEEYGYREPDKIFYYPPDRPWIFCLYRGQDVIYPSGGSPAKDMAEADYLVLLSDKSYLADRENFELLAAAEGHRRKYELWRRKIVKERAR